MKKTGRHGLFAGVLCGLACLLFGCAAAGGAAPQSAPGGAIPGWQQNAGEPATLTWYINFSWFTTTWGQDLVARTITEETGTDIRFITPAGNEQEKLKAMMSSGALPDLVTLGHWEPLISQMIADGLVWPLNELADGHDPYFWQVAAPQRVAWYTRPDGNIYEYPNSSYTPADYQTYGNIGSNEAFLVRKDLYEALGSPDMTTPEGFMDTVRRAVERFPQVNGAPLIPIGLYDFDKDGCFSLEGILMDLLAVPFEKDGQLYDRYTDPDYISWLKVFRRLCQEGYIGSEVLVDRRAQMAEKVAEGRYFCMLYQHTDIADQQLILNAEDPESVYIAVDGPKNAAGDAHTLAGVGINGWTVTLVSKSCPHPDRAIQMMSYMMSEHGQKLLYCGAEGETYDTVDGKPVLRQEVLELLAADRREYNLRYGADNTYWMLQDLAMQRAWARTPEAPLAQPLEWSYPYTVYTAQYDASYTAGSDEAAASQAIKEEWGRTLPALLLAESDEAFDALMAGFVEKRQRLGFETLTQEATRQMAEAKERLGLE